MRRNNSVDAVAYSDPWNMGFNHRFAMLIRGVERVAYYYEKADNSTFRYRVYNPVQVINGLSDKVSAGFFFASDFAAFDEIARHADRLVVCRSPYSKQVGDLISRFKILGKKVFFDIDDFVFDVRYAELVSRTIGWSLTVDSEWNNWYGYVGRQGVTLSLCDECITTNKFLADRIGDYSGKPVRVMRNFINREQSEYSDKIFEAKNQSGKRDDIFKIGYFSGSPTHSSDFQVAQPAIEGLMHEDPRIHLTIAGYMNIDQIDKTLHKRVDKVPFMDFINLQRIIASVDLNIVPLQYNDFTNCKSELKYFEAGIVGTPTVATPTYTFSNSIRHGENGYLAKSYDWKDVIEGVINNQDLLLDAAQASRVDVGERYLWSKMLPEVLAALDLPESDGRCVN